MLPGWRGAVAVIVAAVVLIAGAIALVSARMPAPPAFAVLSDSAQPTSLALPLSLSAGEFESRAALRRSEELRRVLSIRIGPAAAVARAPLVPDRPIEEPATRSASALGPAIPRIATTPLGIADEQRRAKGRAKLATLHLPQQIALEISAIKIDSAITSIAMLPRAAEPMLAVKARPAPAQFLPVAPADRSRPIAATVHVAAAPETRTKVKLAALPPPATITDSQRAADFPAIVAREVPNPENASSELLADADPVRREAAVPLARVPMPPVRRAVSASRRPRPLAAARASKAKKRAAKPAAKSARKVAEKSRLPARRKAAAARKRAPVRRAAAAAAATQQQSPFATTFGGWWQEPARPAVPARQGARWQQGLEF